MSNTAVTICSAAEGVCFLCGNEGPVFEATTPCGRLAAVPVCAKDLFGIVTAQSRANATPPRAPTRGRGKPPVKTRPAGTDDDIVPSAADAGTTPDGGVAAV